MATTTTTGLRSSPPEARLSVAKPRRRGGLMAGGIMVTALGGLLVAWMISTAGDRADVLVLARDVPYGQAIVAGDLTVTAVGVDGLVDTMPADRLESVVGQVAAVDLLAGSLLTEGETTTDTPPGNGQALVPMPVGTERLPAGGLNAGDRLLVVDAPNVGSDPLPTAPATFEVTVVRVGEADLNGVSVLDVVAEESDAPELATRAASGRFALVLLDAAGDR